MKIAIVKFIASAYNSLNRLRPQANQVFPNRATSIHFSSHGASQAMSDLPTDLSTDQLSQLADSTDGQPHSGCCGMSSLLKSGWTLGFLVVATIVATAAAGYFAGQNTQPSNGPTVNFPAINATAAISSEKFSMATGVISDRAEGLFVLDHNSGLLQCSVIYPRIGKFLGLFTTNIGEALATGGKGGQYMMMTGLADFPSSNNNPAASSCIYVLDTATGNYACYGIPFDRVAMNANRPQQGMLVLISTGSANPVVDRNALR